MTEKLPKAEDSRSEAASTDGPGRRKFIKDSLGAAPVVLTIGNRSGWGGGSMHGTLWSSAGTNWRHRGGRWWRKGDWKEWEDPKPPHWSDHDGRREYEPRGDGRKDDEKTARRRDWDWGEDHQNSRELRSSDSYHDAESDWKWYRQKERQQSEFGKAEEKRVNPLEPSKRSER